MEELILSSLRVTRQQLFYFGSSQITDTQELLACISRANQNVYLFVLLRDIVNFETALFYRFLTGFHGSFSVDLLPLGFYSRNGKNITTV